MGEPRNKVHVTADVAAPPDEVFTFFTEHFDQLWQGKMEHLSDGKKKKEPLGLGFVRRMHTPAGALDEEIVTHDRPKLIEYTVIDDEETKIHNHLGHIEFAENGGGTRVDYTIGFDYRPPLLGHAAATAIKLGWRMRGRRVLRREFPG